MHPYLSNIIPRIQRFSKDLGKTEVFVDKAWIFLDDEGNHHEYIFMRDKRLLMSLNGTVKTGRWELLPNGKLLVNRVTDEVMLQNAFIDDAILLLKKSGTQDEPFILMNEQKIPDLDAVRYLQNVEERRVLDYEIPPEGTVRVLSSGRAICKDVKVGDRVIGEENALITATYQVKLKGEDAFIDVKNGLVTRVFYRVSYLTKDKKPFQVEQLLTWDMTGGKIVGDYKSLGFIPNTKIYVTSTDQAVYHSLVIDENGVVRKNIDEDKRALFIVIVIVILIVALVIYMNQW